MAENNFWNACPRDLQYHPTHPCEYVCEWRIVSKVNNNCFWTYIRNNSREDGTMKPLQSSEIAKLLGVTTSKANEFIEEAEEAMKYILLKSNLKSDPDTPAEDIGPIIMPEEELEDQDAFDIIIEDI